MARITRRGFMAGSAAAGALVFSNSRRVLGANEDVRVAVIGCGGRGSAHLGAFSSIKGSRVVAVCDPDDAHIARFLTTLDKKQMKAKGFKDYRKLLEDKEIDAVACATPNHWHSLNTVWACQAGKDVYVEKPISHNVWEGRKCVEAAAKYNRVVQHGTQRRSDKSYYEVFDFIKKGNLGAVQWVKGFCYKPRQSIGKVSAPTPIPPGVDYDLWCGPAPKEELMRKKLHYDWHWVWPTGNGDIGNQGVHEMDMCRWFLGNNELPTSVMSIGGRFVVEDDATTPNTLISYYDYKPVPMMFEVRGLPSKKPETPDGKWPAMDAYGKLIRVGVWVQCENGYYAAGEGGGWIYDKDGKKVKEFPQRGQGDHMKNFVNAVQTRKPEDNVAPAEVAHLSSALCHLGNISYRVGKEASAEEITASIKTNAQAAETFERMKDHLGKNGVDLAKTKIVQGPTLTIDPKAERFTGQFADEANKYIKDNYRKPFEVPETV